MWPHTLTMDRSSWGDPLHAPPGQSVFVFFMYTLAAATCCLVVWLVKQLHCETRSASFVGLENPSSFTAELVKGPENKVPLRHPQPSTPRGCD